MCSFLIWIIKSNVTFQISFGNSPVPVYFSSMVSFHFEEEGITLEVLRNRIVKLQTVFIVACVLMLVLITAANLATIYLHKSEDHGYLVVSKEFQNVTYMDFSNLSSLVYSQTKQYGGYWLDFFAPDALYAAYSEADLDEFLEFAKKYPFAPYSLENHDCDDFAHELHGLEVTNRSRGVMAAYRILTPLISVQFRA